MQKNILFLFTNEFPYGNGESFISAELRKHSEHFKSVRLFPLLKPGKGRAVPANVEVNYLFGSRKYLTSVVLRKHVAEFLGILMFEFLRSRRKLVFIRRLSIFKSILLQNIYRADLLEEHLRTIPHDQEIFFYSFWTDDWATALSILKKRRKISSFISRVHGYDLYEERWPGGLIPFRNLQLSQVSKVIAASRDGLDYMINHYGAFKDKFHLNHLSIFDWGMGPVREDALFTVVSCSNLIPLKRVKIIAEALTLIKFPVRWVHFGDGPERKRIEELLQKTGSNVKAELKGNVTNEELKEFYGSNMIHAFIHVSETEGGVPLSLQEAACSGIPLLATTAGGAEEIVNNVTGIPLAADVTGAQLAGVLEKFGESACNTREFRSGVRQFWLDNFGTDRYIGLYNLITEKK